MPIIYTYPTVTPSSNDLILLTDTSDSQKATKTASVSSLLSIGLAQDINSAKVTLTYLQLRSLYTTPIDLVAAPGVGKALVILSASAYLNYNTIAGNAVGINIAYSSTTTDPAWGSANFLDKTTSGGRMMSSLTSANPQWAANEKIVAIASASAGAPNSSVDIYVTYKIIDV